MKTKIKDLNHVIELYESGVLVPMKSILVDTYRDERVFLGFNLTRSGMVTLSESGRIAIAWSDCEFKERNFHIKSKTETIKIEKWACVSPELNVFLLDTQPQDHLNHLIIHNKKITLEFEMERDDE